MKTKLEPTRVDYCPKCGHHLMLHEGGVCQVRIMQSGYHDFASLPKCGCDVQNIYDTGSIKLTLDKPTSK